MENTRFFGKVQLIDDNGDLVKEVPCNHHRDYYNIIMDSIDISSKKNSDYCGNENSDPLKNFKVIEQMGIDPRIGLFVRMMDKMGRISTYIVEGELKVKGEGFEDACSDLLNYSALLHALNTDIERDDKKDVQ